MMIKIPIGLSILMSYKWIKLSSMTWISLRDTKNSGNILLNQIVIFTTLFIAYCNLQIRSFFNPGFETKDKWISAIIYESYKGHSKYT